MYDFSRWPAICSGLPRFNGITGVPLKPVRSALQLHFTPGLTRWAPAHRSHRQREERAVPSGYGSGGCQALQASAPFLVLNAPLPSSLYSLLPTDHRITSISLRAQNRSPQFKPRVHFRDPFRANWRYCTALAPLRLRVFP